MKSHSQMKEHFNGQWHVLLLIPFCLSFWVKCTKPSDKQAQSNSDSVSFDATAPDSTLDSYFNQKFRREEPGGAILVKIGDTVLISKGYGLSNLRTLEKASPNTLFNLGSISKTFVSNAILILQTKGKLSVEDNLLK